MIRRATAIWLGLAAVVGFSVFHLKHEVQALDEELARLNRAILAEQQAIHILRAEWSYLNQPARLQALAGRHLDLREMQPGQIAEIQDLPLRPPADNPASPPLAGQPGGKAVGAVPGAGRGRAAEIARPQAAPRPVPPRAPTEDARAVQHQNRGTR